MRQVMLPGTDIRTSRFVFGTASLFNAGSPDHRTRLLDAAMAHGFTHFDTAPYYAFGLAERELGLALKRNPEATVTTKVGLYAPGGEDQFATTVFLRKAAGKLRPRFSRATADWSVARGRQSLEGSLRRLGRDRIDLYTLHEPQLHLLNVEEWRRWLEDEVRAGRVRAFGLALHADRLEPFLAAGTALTEVVQTTDSLAGREADVILARGRPLQITYGYVSAARAAGDAADVPSVLRRALTRNATGAIIVSTRRPERVAIYPGLAEEAQP